MSGFSLHKGINVTTNEFNFDWDNPEKLLLTLVGTSRKSPIPFGAICYSIRKKYKYYYKVNIDSLRVERREVIKNVIDSFKRKASRQQTVHSYLRDIMVVFDWIDSNGHSDFLESKSKCILAYRCWSDFLYSNVINSKYSPSTASRRQRAMGLVLDGFYDTKTYREILASAPKFPEEKGGGRAAPSKEEVDTYLKPFINFTRNLSKSLMNGDDFPLKIDCGEYDVHLIPSLSFGVDSPFITPRALFWDSKNKRYRTDEEYINLSKHKASALRNFNDVQCINKGGNDKFKAMWGQYVVKAYCRILEIITGAYSSEIIPIEYEQALEFERSTIKKEFVTVKFRAGGAVQKYTIHNKGLMILKEYLKFRSWFLDGRETNLLFFNLIEERTRRTLDIPKKLDDYYSKKLHSQLKGRILDPKIKMISARNFRKYKSSILKYFGYSLKETAEALQHTEEINRLSYNRNNESDAITELSEYWKAVRINVKNIKIEDVGDNSKDITVGHCSDYGSPRDIKGNPSIEPECLKPHGCLFCDKYLIHADENDIHKICSLKYVVDMVRENVRDYEKADTLFRELSVRVEFILQEMIIKYPKTEVTITNIKDSVFNYGLLTPFWEDRLSRFEELGVI